MYRTLEVQCGQVAELVIFVKVSLEISLVLRTIVCVRLIILYVSFPCVLQYLIKGLVSTFKSLIWIVAYYITFRYVIDEDVVFFTDC